MNIQQKFKTKTALNNLLKLRGIGVKPERTIVHKSKLCERDQNGCGFNYK